MNHNAIPMDFKRSFTVRKPVDDVWEVLGNQFGQACAWASGLHHSEVSARRGDRPTHRACTADFGDLKEEVLRFDPDEYVLAYRVLEGFPGFVDSGVNHWRLTGLPDGTTRVDMHLRIVTKGLVGAVMSPMMRMQMNGLTKQIVEDFTVYLETGRPSAKKAKELAKLRKNQSDPAVAA